MNIDQLTIGDAKQLAALFGDAQRNDDLMSGINFVLFMGGLLVAHNIG